MTADNVSTRSSNDAVCRRNRGNLISDYSEFLVLQKDKCAVRFRSDCTCGHVLTIIIILLSAVSDQ